MSKDCGKHVGMIVMHAFSTGECKICGHVLFTGHIPCDKVCEECSEKHILCKVCGEEIKEY
jgi:hypothetical protein